MSKVKAFPRIEQNSNNCLVIVRRKPSKTSSRMFNNNRAACFSQLFFYKWAKHELKSWREREHY